MATNEYPGLNPQPSPFPGDPNQPPMPPQAEPTPQVPPPPSTESQVGVRTMSGDVSSLSSSGGETQQPKTFRPKDLIGGEPVFQPGTAATPTPAEAKSKHAKVLMLAVAGALLAIGLAVAGFILVPKLIQTTPPVVTVSTASLSATPSTITRGEQALLTWETTNATDVSIESIGPVELSGSRAVFPETSTTYRLMANGSAGVIEATAEVIVNEPVAAFQHQSMFPTSSNVASISVAMSIPSPANFNTALKTGMAAETGVPVFKEVLPMNSMNASLDAYAFFPLFMPSLTREYLTTTVNQDFSAFVYKDANGIWPGLAVKLNNTVPPPTMDASGAPVQGPAVTADATELINAAKALPTVFYVEDPGAARATSFAAGTKFNSKIQSIEYLAYTKSGASFNVATLKNGNDTYVIWSTSFNGLKESIKQLGF